MCYRYRSGERPKSNKEEQEHRPRKEMFSVRVEMWEKVGETVA
jgi:hypothetical protein